MSEERSSVNTPMDARHLQALGFIKGVQGYTFDTDAVRKSVIEYAKSLGWQDPQLASPTPATRRTTNRLPERR